MRAATLALAFALAAAPSCFLWLAFGAALRRSMADPERSRIFNVAMGLVLAASIATIV